MGVRRCRHVGVNSPTGHSKITAILLMQAEGEAEVMSVQWNMMRCTNWISRTRLLWITGSFLCEPLCSI